MTFFTHDKECSRLYNQIERYWRQRIGWSIDLNKAQVHAQLQAFDLGREWDKWVFDSVWITDPFHPNITGPAGPRHDSVVRTVIDMCKRAAEKGPFVTITSGGSRDTCYIGMKAAELSAQLLDWQLRMKDVLDRRDGTP